jgi:hypothetical protein
MILNRTLRFAMMSDRLQLGSPSLSIGDLPKNVTWLSAS